MNRAGEFIRNMTGEAAYMSFRPASLPPEPPLELDADLIRLLIDANCELARLNTAAAMIPSILEVADDLWHDCQIHEYGGYNDPVWEAKYIDRTYPQVLQE